MKSRKYSFLEFVGVSSYLEIDPRLLLIIDTIVKICKNFKPKVFFEDTLGFFKDLNIQPFFKGRFLLLEFSSEDQAYNILNFIIYSITSESIEDILKSGVNETEIYNFSFCFYSIFKNYLYIDTLNHGEDKEESVKILKDYILY